jgi:hypothetical protein
MRPTTKEERIKIVNEIIKEIAQRGRKFFAYQGRVAEIKERNRKIYYYSEYLDKDLCVTLPDCRKPKGWHHGGTLWGLIKDFRDFVKTGEYSNNKNGYGGLYSSHWGYPENDMKAIQAKAIELGYLIDELGYLIEGRVS